MLLLSMLLKQRSIRMHSGCSKYQRDVPSDIPTEEESHSTPQGLSLRAELNEQLDSGRSQGFIVVFTVFTIVTV